MNYWSHGVSLITLRIHLLALESHARVSSFFLATEAPPHCSPASSSPPLFKPDHAQVTYSPPSPFLFSSSSYPARSLVLPASFFWCELLVWVKLLLLFLLLPLLLLPRAR